MRTSLTLGLVANMYNECNALPGWLETHLPFFDDVRVVHTGPQGELSNDGTLEILKKWNIPVIIDSIDDGFGAVRTRTIHSSPCEYVMLLDADERFYPVHRHLMCTGNPTPWSEMDPILTSYTSNKPDWEAIGRLGASLCIDIKETYNQGAWLREIITKEHPDAVCTIRRHWHDLSFRRPTQSWMLEPDWQMRIIRNDKSIYFDPDTPMHERLVGVGKVVRADFERGPFFDHFHFLFKKMEMDQRYHDVKIYDAIHERRKPPTLEELR